MRNHLLTSVRTTDDFFDLRYWVQNDNNGSKEIRNEKIEEAINGNETFEYLHNWSKFVRMSQNSITKNEFL